MKILLTHGYFIEEDERERKIMKPYPPLGILGITAWLRHEGYTPEVFDTTFSTFAELCRQIKETTPDVLGIYTNLMTKLRVLDIIRFVKGEESLANTRIVLGGPEVTYHVEQFL
ncbi:MAG: cobalamin-dependent protein, partial [Candidatus Kapaibacterium sp.]